MRGSTVLLYYAWSGFDVQIRKLKSWVVIHLPPTVEYMVWRHPVRFVLQIEAKNYTFASFWVT